MRIIKSLACFFAGLFLSSYMLNALSIKEQLFFSAAASGDFDLLKGLLSEDVDVNVVNQHNATALHEAAFNGKDSCVQVLIDAGIDFHILNNDGLPAVMLAAAKGHLSCVKKMCDFGADINIALTEIGDSALHFAARNNAVQFLETLLRADANPNVKNNKGETPLHVALFKGNIVCVEELLKAGADSSQLTGYGEAPLCIATKQGHSEAVRDLITHHANAKMIVGKGFNLLHIAAQHHSHLSIQPLVEAGVDVNQLTENFVTPLGCAAYSGAEYCLQELVDSSACVDLRGNKGMTALHIAVMKQNIGCVKRLIQAKADVNICADDGRTPLHFVATCNFYKAIPLLKMAGADLSIRDIHGKTALHRVFDCKNTDVLEKFIKFYGYEKCVLLLDDIREKFQGTLLHKAAAQGNIRTMQLLLKLGANLDSLDHNQNTPLHAAALAFQPCSIEAIIKMLGYERCKDLLSDSYIDVPTQKNMTLLHLAAAQGCLQCLKLCLELGADINQPDNDLTTPLIAACIGNNVACVQELIKQGASTEQRGASHNTPLHFACYCGSHECVQALLEAKVSIFAVNKWGERALDIACDQGHGECVQRLLKHRSCISCSRDYFGRAALHIAAACKNRQPLKELLNGGACVDFETTDGVTALFVAVEEGIIANVQTLLLAGADPIKHARDGESPLSCAFLKREKNPIIFSLIKSALKKDFHAIQFIEKADEDFCSICCEEYVHEKKCATLSCQHDFCVLCLDSLLVQKENATCPLCRVSIDNNFIVRTVVRSAG